jgi:dihydroflavonol-4-reductase
MVTALVTGGTGFVGSHVARSLAADGHSVRVLHRTTSRLDALAGVEYESVLGDILDLEALRRACEGCEWVFHVAAVADYWRADKERMYRANVDGTRLVLQAAREAGVRRVVFTSSAAAVGLRDDGQPADESMAFSLPPERFPYGHSKALAEQVVAEAVAAGQEVVIINPVVVMGPGDLNMISGSLITYIKRLQWAIPVTSGSVAIVDVRDVARGHIAAAERGRVGERYLLVEGNYPFRQFFGTIADVVGVAPPFIPLPDFVPPIMATGIELLRRVGISTPIDANQTRLGTRCVCFDGSKARRELAQPEINMRRSLQDTYEWYYDHGYIGESMIENAIRQTGKLIGLRPRRAPHPAS